MTLWLSGLIALLGGYAAIHALRLRGRGLRPAARWRWPVALALLAGCGLALVLWLSERLASREFEAPQLLEQAARLRPPDWAVVIGRRVERTGEDDPAPYRNSPLALYERSEGELWVKRHGDLMCRSTTTTAQPPAITDRGAVESFSRERGTRYRWGHVSVPFGRYSLTPTPWRTGDTALLVSTLHSTGGTIALEEPQVLTCVTIASDEVTGEPVFVPDPEMGALVSYVKEWCFIHPSSTGVWSHRDSLGCINLFKRPGENPNDYDTFWGWIEEHGLTREPLALVVAPFEELAGEGAEELPRTLTLEGL